MPNVRSSMSLTSVVAALGLWLSVGVSPAAGAELDRGQPIEHLGAGTDLADELAGQAADHLATGTDLADELAEGQAADHLATGTDLADELAEGQAADQPVRRGFVVVLAQEEPAPGDEAAAADQAEGEPGAEEPDVEGSPPASAEPAGVLAPAPAEGDEAEGAPAEAAPEASPAEPAPEPASPAEAPVTVDGQSSGVSRPFALRGGDYAVSWTAQTSNPECAFTASLHDSATARPVQPLGSGQVFGGRGSGQSILHAIPAASYYVDTISTCRWSLIISALP